MKFWVFSKIKCNVIVKRHLLNFLLLFFSPRDSFIVALSQNLDKYIVLYQKELISSSKHKLHVSKSIKEVAA